MSARKRLLIKKKKRNAYYLFIEVLTPTLFFSSDFDYARCTYMQMTKRYICIYIYTPMIYDQTERETYAHFFFFSSIFYLKVISKEYIIHFHRIQLVLKRFCLVIFWEISILITNVLFFLSVIAHLTNEYKRKKTHTFSWLLRQTFLWHLMLLIVILFYRWQTYRIQS